MTATAWPVELPDLESADPYKGPSPTAHEQRNGDDGVERAALRFFLYYVAYVDEFGIERKSLVQGEGTIGGHGKMWRPPAAIPMVRYDVSDWHGSATLDLPEAWPESERERQVAIARTIHGPHSSEQCCRRRLAKGGGTFVEQAHHEGRI